MRQPPESSQAATASPPLEASWNCIWFIVLLWLVIAAANYATGRAARFPLAMTLWACTNLFLLVKGRGFFDLFLLIVIPSILLGHTDAFDFLGVTVEMHYLISVVNLIPYCLSGAVARHFPERNRVVSRSSMAPYMALFLAACVLSSLPAHVRFRTESFRMIGLAFAFPFFFYYYSSRALSRFANIKQVASVVVFFASYYAVPLGVLQLKWKGTFSFAARNLTIYPDIYFQRMWETLYKEAKILSIYPDSSLFGHIMIFAFPLAFGLYLLAKNRWEKIYYFGALALIGLGVIITGNRTDLLGLMISIGIVVPSFALRSASLRKTVLKFTAVSIVAVLAIMTVRENNSFRRLFMPDEWDSHTASGRTLLIKEGIRMFREQPLTGVGVAQYIHNQNYRDPTTGEFLVRQHAHNFMAQIAAETGVIGTTAFLILIANAFRFLPITWRHRKESELDFMCFLLFVSCISLLSQGFIENSLFYFQTSALFWMGIGIWRGRALERLDKEE